MGSNSPCFAIPHSPSSATFQHPHQFNQLTSRSPYNHYSNNTHNSNSYSGNGMDAPRSTLKRKPSLDHDSPMPSSGPPSPSADDQGEAKVKRVRTTAELVSKSKAVNKLIATLNVSQLVNLISTLVESHPSLAEEIGNIVPRPTVASVEALLSSLETKLQNAFPYTKWGPGRDDYSFNRVKPALEELMETLIDYTNHFTSPPEFPATSFAFLHIATEFAHRLPVWDNAAHNEHKTDLYRSLAEYWIKAIQDAGSKLEDGKIYGQKTVQEWAEHLEHHNIKSQGRFTSAIEEFKSKLGWIIGIQPSYPNYINSAAGSPAAN